MADDPKKDAALETMFWTALRSDMTVMLGLDAESEQRPMTAQLATKEDHGPIWFFGAKSHDWVRKMSGATPANFAFVSKNQNVWATVAGTLTMDDNRAMIDQLWNSNVAAWYEKGKDDPDLALLRFDARHAKIWKDGSSLVAGVLALFGSDPKESYKDNIAEVSLR